MKTLRAVAMLALLCVPLAAAAAASADEAVAGLIASLKGAGARPGSQADAASAISLLERLRPHLTGSSQRMVESMLRAAQAARLHDETARKAFGPALARQAGYVPAAAALGQFIAFALPLATLTQGSAAEIAERSSAGDDLLYRVRWIANAGGERERVEEIFIAVREAGSWKLLVPGFGSSTFGSQTRGGVTENYMEREKRPWSAAAMRGENEAAQRKIEDLAGLFDSMTGEVKAGRFRTPKAYVDAIAARAQRM